MQDQSQESSCHHKGIMVFPQHHRHHHDASDGLLSSCSFRFDGVSTTNGGPMFCASSNQTLASCMGDMYGGGGAGGSAPEIIWEPPNTQHNSDLSFTMSSSGELGAPLSGKAVAFSAAQWQELERQTMIYKYMMASASIPPELLIPIPKNPSNINPNGVRGGSMKLGVSSSRSSSSDPEPWRCRRTDGKKWRCSRDVVPDQKYCERHSHKSRPRSRKPVELPSHSTTNCMIDQFASRTTTIYHQDPHFVSPNETYFPDYSTLAAASPTCYHPRDLKWSVKEGRTTNSNASNQDLQQLVRPEIGLSRDDSKFAGITGFDYDQHYRQHDQTLTASLGSLEGLVNPSHTQAPETRHFFDAWSKAERDANNIKAVSTNCSLTLSVSGANDCNGDRETEENQMGERHPWMSQDGLWMGSPPGGPLAEALRLGVPNSAKGDLSGCNIGSTTDSSCSRSTS